MHKQLNIIIEGAQSTGKSTLITQLQLHYPNSTIISQIARTVIKTQKISNYDLQNNINNCFEQLQYKIFRAQCLKQKQVQESMNTILIFDRCVISPLVYSEYYFKDKQQLRDKIEKSQEFLERVKWYREGAVVFLLCPQEAILVKDGVRKECSFQELEVITDIYRKVLKKYGIRYCEIKDLQNRVETVQSYLKQIKG